MNRDERIRQVTQPVRIIREDGSDFLHFESPAEGVSGKMRHMQPVLDCTDASKLLLLADDEWTARQAALIFMGRRMGKSGREQKSREDELCSELSRSLELFRSAARDAGHGEAFTGIDWEADYLMLQPGDLCDEEPEFFGRTQILIAPAPGEKRRMGALDLAHNVYLDCFRESMSDALVDGLAALEPEVMVAAVPRRGRQEYYLKRLAFEQGFRIVELGSPGEEYYAGLLKRYLRVAGAGWQEEADAGELIRRLKQYRGSLFCEADIFCMADAAMEQCGKRLLAPGDFRFYGAARQSGLERLERLIGLEGVKKSIRGTAAMQQMQVRQGMDGLVLHRNLAFAGPPGTGKSVVAGIYGEILAELGVSNGKFVSAGRRDMVGQYLGHTAEKMHALFRRARGGVLFIDEAGGLNSDDSFTRECITELVRYMEEQPETTVILATYPLEMDALLKSDPGLSSRIQRVIRFEGYRDGELFEILRFMAGEAGFALADGAERAVYEYIAVCRSCRGRQFGNAREMRRLLELALEAYSLRTQGDGDRIILAQDIDVVRDELLSMCLPGRTIGFGREVN